MDGRRRLGNGPGLPGDGAFEAVVGAWWRPAGLVQMSGLRIRQAGIDVHEDGCDERLRVASRELHGEGTADGVAGYDRPEAELPDNAGDVLDEMFEGVPLFAGCVVGVAVAGEVECEDAALGWEVCGERIPLARMAKGAVDEKDLG